MSPILSNKSKLVQPGYVQWAAEPGSALPHSFSISCRTWQKIGRTRALGCNEQSLTLVRGTPTNRCFESSWRWWWNFRRCERGWGIATLRYLGRQIDLSWLHWELDERQKVCLSLHLEFVARLEENKPCFTLFLPPGAGSQAFLSAVLLVSRNRLENTPVASELYQMKIFSKFYYKSTSRNEK